MSRLLLIFEGKVSFLVKSMVTSTPEAPCLDLKDIEKRLKSQKTFESALRELQAFVVAKNRVSLNQEFDAPLQHINRRVMVLLRSRYSSPAFWLAAKEAFLTCQVQPFSLVR